MVEGGVRLQEEKGEDGRLREEGVSLETVIKGRKYRKGGRRGEGMKDAMKERRMETCRQ